MKLEDAGRIGCGIAKRYGTSGEVWVCKPAEHVKYVETDIPDDNDHYMFRQHTITEADRAMTDWFHASCGLCSACLESQEITLSTARKILRCPNCGMADMRRRPGNTYRCRNCHLFFTVKEEKAA